MSSLLHYLRLSPQQTPQLKTPFRNNSSIFIEVYLPRRCIETVVLLLLRVCSYPQDLSTESLPSNERLLWFHYSDFQASCHNIKSIFAFPYTTVQERTENVEKFISSF
jgi:hypothetical protein